MEIKGKWCGYTIEDDNKTMRFKTKDGIRGCDFDIIIKDGKCYNKYGEIETISMEHLITIPEAEYYELLEYKSMYEDLCR